METNVTAAAEAQPEKKHPNLRFRNGRWYARVSIGGKQREVALGTAKVSEAKTQLKKLHSRVVDGLPFTTVINRIRWEEAAADVLNDYRANKKRSVDHVERRQNKHLTPFFRGRRLSAIYTSDIRAYIVHRQAEGAAAATINRELAIIKRMFRLAKQGGKFGGDIPHIPMLEEHNARQGFFEREQFDAVLGHLPAPLRPIATLGYYTGFRKAEVLGLQWQHVDRRAGEIKLNPDMTKNREGRTVPYDEVPELKALIDTQWEAHRALATRGVISPWVFTRANGKPVRSFQKAWKTACTNAGCPGRLFHDFRRTAVRNLTRLAVPRSVAMSITGHKTESVFRRYDIVDGADRRDAMRRLASAAS